LNHEFSRESLEQFPLAVDRLPTGWSVALVADVASEIAPGFASGEHDSGGNGCPHMRPMNIDRCGNIDLSVVKSVPSTQGRTLSYGDVLFNNTNSPELVGKTALIGERERDFAFSNHMTRIRLEGEILPSYVAHFLHFLWMSGYMKHRCTNHVNQASISSKTLANSVPLLIPPASEQIRIVEKLEELLSDVDAGVAELKGAQRKLAQYRQSLLKAATEGALTVDWRASRSKPQETGAELLQHILSERRVRWEQKQLAKFAEQGKRPPKDWQAKYPSPIAPDVTSLPSLPEDWVWASLDMLGEIASGVAKGTKKASSVPTREVPYLRVANVQRGYLDLTQIKTIQATVSEIIELRLMRGDILFNEGGDLDKLGRGWVWYEEVAECIHQNHVFRMRPTIRAVPSEFISHHGNSFGKEWFKKAGKQTTNLASINMTMLRAFPVPVPPESEGREIVARLELKLGLVVDQERSVERGLVMAAAQRKNILKSAFTGQLVPQNGDDEPAAELLSRIRAERVADGATISKRRRKAKEAE
jgi:type I restriction enzyme, S subunit